jgi:excisionase family DNA binding protein
MSKCALSFLSEDACEELERMIDGCVERRLAEQAGAPPVSSPYMTIPEVADYLRCDRQRIYDLRSSRQLTPVREGGRALVLRTEVEAIARAETLSRA